MPSIKGKPKEQISYKCPHDLLQKINSAIECGDYASRNDVITAALILFFRDHYHTGNDCIEPVIDWLTSEAGEKWLQDRIRIVIDKTGMEPEPAR